MLLFIRLLFLFCYFDHTAAGGIGVGIYQPVYDTVVYGRSFQSQLLDRAIFHYIIVHLLMRKIVICQIGGFVYWETPKKKEERKINLK
jgi:hypothetical protein